VALGGQPVTRSRGEGGLTQPPLAAEHQIAAFRMLFDECGERNGAPPNK